MKKSVEQASRERAVSACVTAADVVAPSAGAASAAPSAGGATAASAVTAVSGESAGRKTVKQAVMYYGVSAMQTIIEFAVFAVTQALGLTTSAANGIAVACSGSFNFLMNRNVTFKASSNFARSVVLFVLLYLWNFAFGTWFIGATYATFGLSQAIGKFITMGMQGIWGFCLCKWLIFK